MKVITQLQIKVLFIFLVVPVCLIKVYGNKKGLLFTCLNQGYTSFKQNIYCKDEVKIV